MRDIKSTPLLTTNKFGEVSASPTESNSSCIKKKCGVVALILTSVLIISGAGVATYIIVNKINDNPPASGPVTPPQPSKTKCPATNILLPMTRAHQGAHFLVKLKIPSNICCLMGFVFIISSLDSYQHSDLAFRIGFILRHILTHVR